MALPALRSINSSSHSPRKIAPRPAPLSRTQRWTRRSRSRAKPHSRHQRRRHMAQRLSASRAMLGAGRIGPHPIPLHFTSWIDTLNGGARHHGHSELPQRPTSHSVEVSPLAARNSTNGPSGPANFRSAHLWSQRKTTPTACGTAKYLWKNRENSSNHPAALRRLVTFSHPLRSRNQFPSPHVVILSTAKSKIRSFNGGSHAEFNHQFQCGQQHALSA